MPTTVAPPPDDAGPTRSDAGALLDCGWADERQTQAFATRLAGLLRADAGGIVDALVRLEGPLGAGKTTFVRHLLRALGHEGRVRSPTYALVEPYAIEGPGGKALSVAHIDAYRLADAREAEDAGLRDAIDAPGLRLVEWPGNIAPLMAAADWTIAITPHDDGSRRVRVTAGSARGRRWIERWALSADGQGPAA